MEVTNRCNFLLFLTLRHVLTSSNLKLNTCLISKCPKMPAWYQRVSMAGHVEELIAKDIAPLIRDFQVYICIASTARVYCRSNICVGFIMFIVSVANL